MDKGVPPRLRAVMIRKGCLNMSALDMTKNLVNRFMVVSQTLALSTARRTRRTIKIKLYKKGKKEQVKTIRNLPSTDIDASLACVIFALGTCSGAYSNPAVALMPMTRAW